MHVFHVSDAIMDWPSFGGAVAAVCLAGGILVPVGQTVSYGFAHDYKVAIPRDTLLPGSVTRLGHLPAHKAALPKAVAPRLAIVEPAATPLNAAAGRYGYVIRIALPPPRADAPTAAGTLPRPVAAEESAALAAASAPSAPSGPASSAALAIDPAGPVLHPQGISGPPEEIGPALVQITPSTFDLAQLAATRAVPTSQLAGARTAARVGKSSLLRDTVSGDSIFHQADLTLGDSYSGAISVRIGPDGQPTVKVGDLLGAVAGGMDPDLFARLSASGSAASFVSFSALRAAGLSVAYDPVADRVTISAGE